MTSSLHFEVSSHNQSQSSEDEESVRNRIIIADTSIYDHENVSHEQCAVGHLSSTDVPDEKATNRYSNKENQSSRAEKAI